VRTEPSKILSEARQPDRSQFIDSLRGISILLVLLHHGDNFFTVQASSLAPLLPPTLTDALFRSGYYGVTIFFVISGYLITRISLLRYGALSAIRPSHFYLFRFGRIAPCLFLTLTVLLTLHFGHARDFVYDTQKASISQLLSYTLTCRYNVLYCKIGWGLLPWDILWSLSIEEMFYLLFPLLCLLFRTRIAMLSACFLLIVAGPIARFSGASDFDKLYGYFGCFDLIALGCATAIIQSIVAQSTIVPKFSAALSVIGLSSAIGALTTMPIPANIILGPSVLGIGIALLLFGLTGSKPETDRSFATLVWPLRILGKRSYEIYLFHATILLLLVNYLKGEQLDLDLTSYSPVLLPLYLLTCAAGGELVGKFWTEPANRFIRRLHLNVIFQSRAEASNRS
jgi:peptidoglycan/LPS O-acetylase OafA/YrhL